jgi:CDP-glucose 4,6-dehydratase
VATWVSGYAAGVPGAANAAEPIPRGATPRGAVDPAFWRGRRVLVTGHNGFKGAWLCLWLQALGARVSGVSLSTPPTTPSLYELAGVEGGMAACFACDVRDAAALADAVRASRPEVVIHMAAQPLVRASFAAPAETFAVNALGTAALLDAVRGCETVRAVVVVTSDKCYAPRADGRPHVEEDPFGGDDPYSASKACAELVVAAYRDTFFGDFGDGGAGTDAGPSLARGAREGRVATARAQPVRVASARAGNVIGGGDFGAERLLPDVFRAALAGEPLLLRNPEAVRPWQHVLSPLSGYLLLAQALCGSSESDSESCAGGEDGGGADGGGADGGRYARAWNFGPADHDARTVCEIVERVAGLWPGGIEWQVDEREHPRENPALRLDSTRARGELGWGPLLTLEQGLAMTVEWFRAYGAGEDVRAVMLGQLPVATIIV